MITKYAIGPFGKRPWRAHPLVDGIPYACRLGIVTNIEMKKILLVEDNEECRKMLTCIMQHLGYEVIQAPSGLVAAFKAASERPALIFISLDFPEMHGLDTIFSLKNNPQSSDIPILVFPPWNSEKATEAALNAGATGVLREPFTLQSFRIALNKLAPSDTEFLMVRAGISILSL